MDLDEIKFEPDETRNSKSQFVKPSMRSLDLSKVKTSKGNTKKLPVQNLDSGTDSNTDSERSLQGAEDVVAYISQTKNIPKSLAVAAFEK